MASHLTLFLVALVAVLSTYTEATWTQKNPGFKARITQSGLKFINDVGVSLLTKDIKGETIPDISGNAHVAIGNIDYTVSSMRITDFGIPSTSLTSKPGIGLQFHVTGGSISLHGDWRYKYKKGFIHISDHGSFDATAHGLNLNLVVKLGKDGTGRPTIAPAGCTGGVSSISVKFHGGASWLYNLFSGSIEDSMKSSLNSKVCEMVNEEITTRASQSLADLKIITSVGPYTELDYSLVDNPTFTTSYMETDHKGEFYPTGHFDKEAPFPVPAMDTTGASSKMVYMWITDYVINTAGYVFQTIGKLTYNITNDMIPPDSAFHLNTSDIGILIPQLRKLYPNMLMELVANSTKSPKVEFSPNDATGTLWGDLFAYVVLPNATRKHVFTLSIVGHGNGTVGFKHPKVTGKVTSMSVDLTLKESDIGPFSLILIRPGINALIQSGVVPYLNELGKEGLPIPDMDGVTFVNPVISLGKHVIEIGTDLKYTPED